MSLFERKCGVLKETKPENDFVPAYLVIYVKENVCLRQSAMGAGVAIYGNHNSTAAAGIEIVFIDSCALKSVDLDLLKTMPCAACSVALVLLPFPPPSFSPFIPIFLSISL